tara:strand:- start:490 stop:1269 length:780 start_codon:yes stop_codon:yes gene_type:complete
MSVIKSNRINISDIEFSKPKTYSIGKGAAVSLYYKGQAIYMQTPRMLSLYGLNIFKDESSNDKIKSINLVLQFNIDVDKTPRVSNFLTQIKKLDKLVAKKANLEHKYWLHESKPLNKDYIDALQKKSLYYSLLQNMEINHSKPPTFKVKIPYYNNEIQNLIIFDKDKNKVDYTIEELEKKLKGEVIIKCIINPSIYIVNQNFGITYNLKALQIIDKKISPKTKKKKIAKPSNNINNYFNEANKLSDSSEDNLNNDINEF